MRTLLLLSIALTCCSASLQAQDLEKARAFVTDVYSQYKGCSVPNSDDCGSDLEPSWFSKSLWHLIELDRQAAAKAGGNPKLDDDPICDCQDPAGLQVVNLRISPQGKGRAIAIVTLNSAVGVVRLSLLSTKTGWRIDDISADDTPSLRKYLEAGSE
jgi:hypothetical protein